MNPTLQMMDNMRINSARIAASAFPLPAAGFPEKSAMARSKSPRAIDPPPQTSRSRDRRLVARPSRSTRGAYCVPSPSAAEAWAQRSRRFLNRPSASLVSSQIPISYPWYWFCFNDAAIKAGVGALGTHTLRHTYRSWMDSVGTPIAVQQKLMRHSDIRTTMNVYGDVVDDRMKEAHSKVAALVFTSTAPEKSRSEQETEDHSNPVSTPRSVRSV